MTKFILNELSRYTIGTYGDIIYRNALLYPENTAFKCGQDILTFSQFNEIVNRLIHALKSHGAEKGDVLGILSWNCLEYTQIYGATMKGGFIASPLNARLQADELDYLINYSETHTLFVGPQLVEAVNGLRSRIPNVKHFVSIGCTAPGMTPYEHFVAGHSGEEPAVEVEEDDPVFIFYTSGTTGVPRGALYTQGRAMDDTRRFPAALCVEQGDKQVQIMPLFHVGGAKNLWGYFFAAATNVIMPQISFDPEATLQTIHDEKATDIHIVPTHLAAFLALPCVDEYDLTSLKRMFYAASPMPLQLLKRGMEKWGPIFLQFYGATEDGPNVTYLSKQQHQMVVQDPGKEKILGSAGFPHIGVHVRIVSESDLDVPPGEVGEIIVKSKSTMLEWWRKPEDTARTIVDGWVHTGDMGVYDEEGYIYIVDRKKDMIVSGGENIFPREVEEILYRHPAVLEAAVFGIPDLYWIEKVHAVVVKKKESDATEREIIEFCKERLARFKAPKSLAFATEIPKNPAGKILKKQLRAIYWEGMDRKI
ncbi:MAG: AMP-binding protein [Deltaproteobacteria bacterium]|nr:AMP-binding protein [Deltaproteobacteria bacterium]